MIDNKSMLKLDSDTLFWLVADRIAMLKTYRSKAHYISVYRDLVVVLVK